MLPKRCLQLDVGNSSAKWRLRVDGVTVNRGRYVAQEAGSREALLGCSEQLDAIWVSSVASEVAQAELAELLRERWQIEPWFARSEVETLGLRNSYAEPARMGVDRWLAMLAARERHPGQRLCVVDSGSALTIDLVAADGRHEGGYIIPGPLLMERALLLDTDRVRFAEDVGYGLEPGQSTAEAVRHGVALAQLGAIEQSLRQAAQPGPQLIVTGGGGEWLAAKLSVAAELAPDLVLDGLQIMGVARAS